MGDNFVKNIIGITLGLTIVLGIVIIVVVSGSESKQVAKDSVVENYETVERVIYTRLETFSFEESVNKADLVAEVVIGKNIDDISEPSPKTLFEANIINTFSGDPHQTNIQILQQGNKEYSFNSNKLFNEDEKYILVLKKAVEDRYEGTNTYWILGEETNIYTIIGDNKIKKMSIEDEFLKEVEIKDEDLESQLLDKNLFEEKIKKVMSEQNK